MKRNALTIALLSAIIFDTLLYVFAKLDLFLNPWIADMEMKWWNVFTTKHYYAWVIQNGMPGSVLLLGIAGGFIFLLVLITADLEDRKYR